MTRHGIARAAREVFLTFGAVLGVVCILVTAAGFAFGVKPLIFRSGSMSPAIHTGDMAISRTVEASTLRRGDIVSVTTSGGQRVTHRLVNAARQGPARQLTLKGDANKKADTEVYTVTRAERVVFTIPKAGYVVNAATSPAGVFVLGLYVAWMLVTVFRRGSPPGAEGPSARYVGSRRSSRRGTPSRRASRSAAVAVVGTTFMVATPAMATTPWIDDPVDHRHRLGDSHGSHDPLAGGVVRTAEHRIYAAQLDGDARCNGIRPPLRARRRDVGDGGAGRYVQDLLRAGHVGHLQRPGAIRFGPLDLPSLEFEELHGGPHCCGTLQLTTGRCPPAHRR